MLTPNPVQTTYNRYQNVGQVGMPATTTGWDVSTRIAEDLASPPAGIPFGRVVSQGTLHGDRSACLGHLSGRVVIGITASDKTLPQRSDIDADAYADGDNMAVAVRGDWWVLVTGTVAAGGAVYYNTSTGELGPSGISNASLLDGAQWITSEPLAAGDIMKAAVGTLAIVRLVAFGSFT